VNFRVRPSAAELEVGLGLRIKVNVSVVGRFVVDGAGMWAQRTRQQRLDAVIDILLLIQTFFLHKFPLHSDATLDLTSNLRKLPFQPA
jgi:hypothetical protein